MEDSLVVEEGMLVNFPLVPFATCLLHLQLLLQGFFHQEEIKQPHYWDTQRPNIMNYLGPPEAPDHFPLATLPSFPELCNHCGKNFRQKTVSLSTCWWSMEQAVSKKSRIRETKHISTDADSSTNTTVGWTKNTQKTIFLKNAKKSSKTHKLKNV